MLGKPIILNNSAQFKTNKPRDNIYPASLNQMVGKRQKRPGHGTDQCVASDIIKTFAGGKAASANGYHTPSVKLTKELLIGLEEQSKQDRTQRIEAYLSDCNQAKEKTNISFGELLSTASSEKDCQSSPQHSATTA